MAEPRIIGIPFTPKTLPADADERVAEWMGWRVEECTTGDIGVGRYWAAFAPGSTHRHGGAWSDAASAKQEYPRFTTDLNAWPEVHKALEDDRGLWDPWLTELMRVLKPRVGSLGKVPWWDYCYTTATAAERCAALLNMEAQRG